MFENLIYYNKEKIEQYTALICGTTMKATSVGNESSSNATANYLLDCLSFENLLQMRDDYYDFSREVVDVAIKDVKLSSIVRATGEIYVPDQFDFVHLMEEYKPQLLSSIDCKDSEERELLKSVFSNSKMRIPIFCELDSACDYWMGIGKISPEGLQIDYNDLEDYEEKPVTILAKLEARKYFKEKPLPVYDIYKDFLGLSRALRRQLQTEKKNDFESIHVEEDFLSLEYLAIYC